MKTIKIILLFTVALLLTFCGGQSDKELFDSGMSLISEKKYDEAIVVFENLVDENNKSTLAPKALFETAKLYQGQVIKHTNGRESLLKSVEIYKKIYDNYPASEEAENSLFMAGFILANELTDLNAAKKTYELYLEKYPEGQLADDARVELQNLGKTPEEILMEKIQNEKLDEKAI
jgi:TolA-binding protein